jgi:hypothetical protein
MSRKLTPSQRRQIISDYKNGIQNEDYRVLDRGNGNYQVRKRESKFKLPKKIEAVEEENEEEEEKHNNESPLRMTNEELLYKLSNLLQIPTKQAEELPDEHDHEEEVFEEDMRTIQRAAENTNPWQRRRLSLF